MKILSLAVGVVAGAVLTHWWRPILKETMRAGIKAENKVNEMLQVVREELQDVAAEATDKPTTEVGKEPQRPV